MPDSTKFAPGSDVWLWGMVRDFSDVSNLSAIEFRQVGMSVVAQLPGGSLTASAAPLGCGAPKQVLVHRIDEARQVANRKRYDRQKRRGKIAAADLRPADGAGR